MDLPGKKSRETLGQLGLDGKEVFEGPGVSPETKIKSKSIISVWFFRVTL